METLHTQEATIIVATTALFTHLDKRFLETKDTLEYHQLFLSNIRMAHQNGDVSEDSDAEKRGDGIHS